MAGGHLSRGHVRVSGGHAVARGHVGGRGHPGGHSSRGPLHTRRQVWVVLLNISCVYLYLITAIIGLFEMKNRLFKAFILS